MATATTNGHNGRTNNNVFRIEDAEPVWSNDRHPQLEQQAPTLPHSPEAEVGVIGAVLRPDSCVYDHVAWLKPEMFHHPGYRALWRVIQRAEHKDIASVLGTMTDAERMTWGGELDDAGDLIGAGAITEGAINTYVSVVRQKHILREKARLAGDMRTAALQGDTEMVATITNDLRLLDETNAPTFDIGADEYLELDLSIDWVVPKIAARGTTTLVSGAPKVGKSTIARQLCAAVSGGQFWMASLLAERGTALLCPLDEPEPVIQAHLRTLAKSYDLSRMRIMRPPFGLEQVEATMARLKPSMVVIDTLARAVGAEDVNDYAEMIKRMSVLSDMARRHDTAIVAVHHERKAGGSASDGVLGSVGIAGGVDTIVTCQSEQNDDDDIVHTMFTDGRMGKPLPKHIVEMGDDGVLAAELKSRKNREDRERKDRDYRAEILADLAEHGESSRRDIRGRMKAGTGKVNDAIDKLASMGKVEVVTLPSGPKGGKGRQVVRLA